MTSLASLPIGHCLTSAELVELGFPSTTVNRLVSIGALERVTHGVYVRPDDTCAEDRFAASRRHHLTRARAMLRLFPGSYLVGPSACLALDLPVLGMPTGVHLSRATPVHSRRSGLVSRRPWPHALTRGADGALVQEPAAAVIEIAALEGVLPGLVSADAVARRGRFDTAPSLLDAWGRRTGASRARTVVARADGRHESALETQVAFAASLHGLRLRPQVTILDAHGQFVARCDFVVEGHRVVVEVDGMSKYDEGALRREKLRQGDIEQAGWVVVRVGHRELRAGRIAELLFAAISQADAMFSDTR